MRRPAYTDRRVGDPVEQARMPIFVTLMFLSVGVGVIGAEVFSHFMVVSGRLARAGG